MMHDATGPEPDYRPSVGPTMVSITLEEYEALKLDRKRLELAVAALDMLASLQGWGRRQNR